MTTDTTQLQRRNSELSILSAIAQELNREVDLEQALRTTLAYIVRLFNLQTGWIWLMDECQDPYLAVAHHLPPALANNPHRMSGRTYCYCLDSYQNGDLEGAANVNVITCTRLEGIVDGTDGLRHHASVPLHAYGEKLGVLNVASRDWRELSEDDLRLLYAVGDMLSMAIERGRLFRRSADIGAAEERTRLARELHDTVAQGLTAITLNLETADALLEAGVSPDKVRAKLQQALSLTRSNLDDTRRSVQNLRAGDLDRRPFAEALDSLVHDYAARWNLTLDHEITLFAPLPATVENGLYRVAQELLSNVVRHAHATTLKVVFHSEVSRASLLVEDNGQGFDPNQVREGRFGLLGMQERVKLLGGTLKFRSIQDKGTRAEVVVPLQTAEESQ